MGMPLPLPTYTTDDLRDFPDDGQRYELLEGVLLVTPAPGSAHQAVLARLVARVTQYLDAAEAAYVVSPGEIEIAPKTLLEPDLLVVPAQYPPGTPWRAMRDWWLAVEVVSPSSRIYDREFKRDAYLALGVAEVWLIDPEKRLVLVSRGSGARDERQQSAMVWMPEKMRESLYIDIPALFRGLV